MPGIAANSLTALARWLSWTALLLVLASGSVQAQAQEQRLVNVGLRLFPAVLAASQKLDNLASDRPLKLYVVYLNNLPYAQEVAERLEQLGAVKGRRLQVETVAVSELGKPTPDAPFALFLVQRTGPALQEVIAYANQHDVLSFSPFSADVEEGILAGIFVSDRILPYINLDTLRDMSFAFKPFFLKVAQPYVR